MKTYFSFFNMIFAVVMTGLIACSDESEDTIRRNGLHADAGADREAKTSEVILLDGGQSYDEGNGAFNYQWSVKAKPTNSSVSLSDPTQRETEFSANIPGVYVIQLTIIQTAFTDSDEVMITVSDEDEPNNPTPVIISGDINDDRVLSNLIEDGTQPDYIVTNDILVRGNISIAPGVVVAFHENTSLQIVAGSIVAKGTSENRIIFRGMVEQAGFWKGVVVHSNSNANEFDFVTIAHGGSHAIDESAVRSNVTVMGTEVSAGALRITNTVLSHSGGYGLYVRGLGYLNGFANNTFESNEINPSLYIPARIIHTIDLAGTTGLQAVETGGVMLDDMPVTWKPIENGFYLVSTGLFVHSQLTLLPGTVLKMKNAITIDVNGPGSITAIGTSQQPIIFTSTQAGVYWNGLFINSSSENNKLQFVEIANGGRDRIADAAHLANVVVGRFGVATITNSIIRDGLGFGLVTFDTDHVNQDLVEVNTFSNLSSGLVYPDALNYPDRPALAGDWVDYWSFNKGYSTVSNEFYNRQSGTWFAGAATPWEMTTGNGMGIRINEDGTFRWVIAEAGPMTGCASYSAEYMTGTVQYTSELAIFNQDYWRSKFKNPCDASQNVDIEVTPGQIQLPYNISRMYNVITGDSYWELRFTNPDGSSFAFYRRAE